MAQEKKKVELMIVVTSVSSPDKIAEVAKVQGLNPQEVFVRVNFKVGDKEFKASNKLRFLTPAGYQRLLDARASGKEISVTLALSENKDDAFIYVNPEHKVSVDELFSTPLEKVDTRSNIAELF